MPQEQPAWEAAGTVLVADDEPPIREMARRMLEALGFSVVQAADGEEAVERFREQAADIRLVLLDMTMPRLDGEGAFHRLRELDPQVKVILMSGYSEQEIRERLAGEPFADFLQKPFRFQALEERLRQLLGQHPD
jgi:CheY-like chemotaxis protein